MNKLIILDSLLIHSITYDFIVLRKDLRTGSHLIVSEAKWEEEAKEQIIKDLRLSLTNQIARLYTLYLWNNNKYTPYELMK